MYIHDFIIPFVCTGPDQRFKHISLNSVQFKPTFKAKIEKNKRQKNAEKVALKQVHIQRSQHTEPRTSYKMHTHVFHYSQGTVNTNNFQHEQSSL